MRCDFLTKLFLALIAVLLAAIVFRPLAQPQPALAQGGDAYPFQLLEGTVTLKPPDGGQTWGKVAVDMRTGDVWGFPFQAQNTPFPVYGPSDTPKVSHPMYLGKMAFSEAVRHP